MSQNHNILLAYYGDDFTGSTDALEFLSRAGAKTVLFLDNPTKEQLRQFENLDAIGVAGMTRAMNSMDMDGTLYESFQILKNLNPKHVHYKVCSTFDSSPEIGNIGNAIRTGQEVFKNEYTPVLVAAPHLGRYVAFGNLFARMGIGSQGKIYRLDQHPSMSCHPTTPAKDGDLRDHLARQTDQQMGLIDLTDLGKGPEFIQSKLNDLREKGAEIIFFDGMYDEQMSLIGEVFENMSDRTLYSVGSSGVEKALGDYWGKQGKLKPKTDWEEIKEEEAILVLSGSASPITAAQIEKCVDLGWVEIGVEIEALNDSENFIQSYSQQIADALNNKLSVILHTCKGPNDSRLSGSKTYYESKGVIGRSMNQQTAKDFGSLLGNSAMEALKKHPIKRLVIAGGDTSSYAARALEIEAVEMIAPIVPGAPLCKAHSQNQLINGMEINLKGGQVGDELYFENLRKGGI